MLKKIFKYFFLFVGSSAALVLLVVAVLVAIIAYEHYFPDKYRYWDELVAKDPKPKWISEKEYREKLRAGYCWRDRRFYKPEELQQKAMLGFSERMVGTAIILQNSYITTLAGKSYADCKSDKQSCSVWFVPQDYTNAKWDKLLLETKESESHTLSLLAEYPKKQIQQSDDLQKYLLQHGKKGFTLIASGTDAGKVIYGSDCCEVLDKKKAEPMIRDNNLITFAEILPERYIPKGIIIRDYGVGNFYFYSKKLITGLPYHEDGDKNTYQADYSELLLMNNCGDVLWKPYYHLYSNSMKKD